MSEVYIELEPHEGQWQVIESKARWKVLCCGRRWGKSLVAVMIGIKMMLEGRQLAYVMPTGSRCMDPFEEFLKHIPKALIKTEVRTAARVKIEFHSGGSIRFMSGENLDHFRGKKFHYVFVDECSDIQDFKKAWERAIRPTLSDYQGGAMFISTPKGKNFFYELFERGMKGVKDYESFHYPSHTNPYFPIEEMDAAREELSQAAFAQEYLALLTENERNPFRPEKIDANTIKELSKEETICFGIDLGSRVDHTVVIGISETGQQTYYDSFQLSWPETEARLMELPSQITKVIDATGSGTNTCDHLEAAGIRQMVRFIFSPASKTEIIETFIKDVEKDNVKFNEEVAFELHVFEGKKQATGYIKYAAQPGFHDDRVCAFAMANNYRAKEYVNRNWRLYSL